jgi:serine protease Do
MQTTTYIERFLMIAGLAAMALAAGCTVSVGTSVGTRGAFHSVSAGTSFPLVKEDARTGGFEHLLDAVVRIDVRETTFSNGAQRLQRGVGSGVIVSDEGHILTNAHVVSPQAVEISITLASLERAEAHLVGWDHWTDLALLQLDLEKVKARGLEFAVAQFASPERPAAGQTVYAVGTPNGLTRTVTRGIISNPERFFAASDTINGYETGYFNTWLQTDAAINPGNSGGPLVLPDGRIVGINTRGYLGANNLAFAVPANTAREVIADLLEEGRVRRSNIGIRPGPLQDLEAFFKLQANEGMLINNVDTGSPADSAGLQAGDIVLSIDGEPVDGRFPEQLPDILRRIARRVPGTALQLEVKRGDKVHTFEVVTEELESRVGEQAAFEKWGLSVQKISRAVARERRLESALGVLVIGVQAAFPASKAGLFPGDIITSVNRQPLESMEDLRRLHKDFKEEPRQLLLEVLRDRQVSYLVLKP